MLLIMAGSKHTTAIAAMAGTVGFVAVVGAVGFGVGYGVGHRPVVATHSAVGRAYSTSAQVSVESAGWWYEVPLDIRWTDGTGTLHEGTRPTCLLPTGTPTNVRFWWTAYQADGNGGRAVVQVNCP